MTCKKCGVAGHMQKTCGRPKRERQIRMQSCSNCMQDGHTARGCTLPCVSGEQREANKAALNRAAYKRYYERMSPEAKARKQAMAAARGWEPSKEQVAAALDKHRGRVARAREWMRAFKTGRPCMDCGGVFEHVCMDFDHRPGETKRDGISQMVKRGAAQHLIEAEIAKCDFVCSNCHRIRTFARGEHKSKQAVT